MRRFLLVDLDKNPGGVKSASEQEPVIITEHGKDCFVLMTYEEYRRLVTMSGLRQVFGVGETPSEIAKLFLAEIDRVLAAIANADAVPTIPIVYVPCTQRWRGRPP